jgi:hypothetical protein
MTIILCPKKNFYVLTSRARVGVAITGLVSSDDQDSAAAAAAKRLSLVSRALRIATSAPSHVCTRFGIAPLPA